MIYQSAKNIHLHRSIQALQKQMGQVEQKRRHSTDSRVIIFVVGREFSTQSHLVF